MRYLKIRRTQVVSKKSYKIDKLFTKSTQKYREM